MKKYIMISLIIAGMALVGCSNQSDVQGPGQEPPVTVTGPTATPTPTTNTQIDSMQTLHATLSKAVSDLDAWVTHGNSTCPGTTTVTAQGISFHPTAPYPYLTQVEFHVLGDGIDTSFVYTTKDKSAAPTDWLVLTGTQPVNGSQNFPAKGGIVTATFDEAILTLGTVTATSGTTQYSLAVNFHPDTLEKVLVEFPELPPSTDITLKFTGFVSMDGHSMSSPHTMTLRSENYVPFMLPDGSKGMALGHDAQGRILIGGATADLTLMVARLGEYGRIDTLVTTPGIQWGYQGVSDDQGHFFIASKNQDGSSPTYVREFDSNLNLVASYNYPYIFDGGTARLGTDGNKVFAIGTYTDANGAGHGYLLNVKTGDHLDLDFSPIGIIVDESNIVLSGHAFTSFSIHVTNKLTHDFDSLWRQEWQNPDGNFASVLMSLPVEYEGNYRVHALFNTSTNAHVVFDYDHDGAEVSIELREPVNLFDIKPCVAHGYVLVPGEWRKGYKRVLVDPVRGWYVMVSHNEDIDVFTISNLTQID
ncbi:MAG: Ig-like domain-containing protein [Patescibacteria group bacterium]